MRHLLSIGFITGLAVSLPCAALASDLDHDGDAALFHPGAVVRGNEHDAVACLQMAFEDGFRGCLETAGQPTDVIDFALETKRRNYGTPSLLIGFTDFGDVDYAEIVVPAANTIDRYGFVTDGDQFTASGGLLDEFATSDAVSANLQRANPQIMRSARSRVVGHRHLDNGRQRFVIRDAMLDGCRACETVAHVYGYVEFEGARLVEQTTIGWRPAADGHWPDPERVRQRLAEGDVQTLQTRLNAAGYLAGAMDGAYGPMTRSALQEFQKDHCLPVGADWRGGETTEILASLVTAHSLTPAPAPCADDTPDGDGTGAMAMTDRDGLSIENSGPDFFNIFTALVSDACVGRDCTYFTTRTIRRCDDVCTIEGHEGEYVAHAVGIETARDLAEQSTDQSRMISQQGVPRGMDGRLAPHEIEHGLPSQVFRRGCEDSGCESLLVLILNEGEGFFFDIPAGVAGAGGPPDTADDTADNTAEELGTGQNDTDRDEVPASWDIQSEPDIVLEPGHGTRGIAFHPDGGASYNGQSIWPAPEYMDRHNRLHVFISPGEEMAVVRFQEIDYGGIRAGLIDLEAGTIMTDHLVTESESRGTRYEGSVAWSPDGLFAAVPFRTFEYFNHVVFFSTGSGDTVEPYRIENDGRVLTPGIESIALLEDGRARFTVIEEMCDSTGCMMRETIGSRPEHVDLVGLAGPEDPDDTPPSAEDVETPGGASEEGDRRDLEEELTFFDRSLSTMSTATEFFENAKTVFVSVTESADMLHAQRLLENILSQELAAQASIDAARASAEKAWAAGGMTIGGFATKYLVKHAYEEEAPFTRFVSEEVALTVTDAMFNITSGVLSGGVIPLISQSISTTSNIIDSVIAYRELGRDTDTLVENARTYGARTLELHRDGTLTDAQARAHFELAQDLSETLTSPWAPSLDASHKLHIIAQLGLIRIEQGPLGLSLERTENLRDKILEIDTWRAPGMMGLRNPIYRTFADEMAERFGVMNWDPMVNAAGPGRD